MAYVIFLTFNALAFLLILSFCQKIYGACILKKSISTALNQRLRYFLYQFRLLSDCNKKIILLFKFAL